MSVDVFREGTMVYRNLLTSTLNSAFADGDAAVKQNIDTLNVERQLSCRDFFEASVVERAEQNNTFIEIDSEQELLVEDYSLFNGCVDWVAYDAAIASEFSLLPSLAYSLLWLMWLM